MNVPWELVKQEREFHEKYVSFEDYVIIVSLNWTALGIQIIHCRIIQETTQDPGI